MIKNPIQKRCTLKQIEDQNCRQDETAVEVKYQDIEYCMHTTHKTVYWEDHVRIDYQKAFYEMLSLDWTCLKNGISFYNNKTDENIFFRRLKENYWYADTTIKINGKWTESCWTAYIDSEAAFCTLRLFFEEASWFDSLKWVEGPGLFLEIES